MSLLLTSFLHVLQSTRYNSHQLFVGTILLGFASSSAILGYYGYRDKLSDEPQVILSFGMPWSVFVLAFLTRFAALKKSDLDMSKDAKEGQILLEYVAD